MGATNIFGRLEASLFKQGPVSPEFFSCLDVPNGGVLLAIPALLSMGLLRYTGKYFQLPQGYYDLTTFAGTIPFLFLVSSALHVYINKYRYCSRIQIRCRDMPCRETFPLVTDHC